MDGELTFAFRAGVFGRFAGRRASASRLDFGPDRVVDPGARGEHRFAPGTRFTWSEEGSRVRFEIETPGQPGAWVEPSPNDVDRLRAYAVGVTLRHAWPPVEATLAAGRQARIGRVLAGRGGLVREQRSLPWSEVRALRLGNGVLDVLRDDSRGDPSAWSNLRLGDLPNFAVLLRIALEANVEIDAEPWTGLVRAAMLSAGPAPANAVPESR